jgi:hypothetical protein
MCTVHAVGCCHVGIATVGDDMTFRDLMVEITEGEFHG